MVVSLKTCQVNCCMNAPRVELAVGPGLVLDVCRKCATDETAKAFESGQNIGLYTYNGKRVVLPCEGDPPVPREVAFEMGIPRWCEAPPTWSAYMLPCYLCQEEFAHDPTGRLGRRSILCAECGQQEEAPAITPPITEEQAAAEAHEYASTQVREYASTREEESVSAKDDVGNFDQHKPPWGEKKPLWEQLEDPRHRQAAKEAYDERAAIMEHDGEQPKLVAEDEAYREVADKAVDAKLVTHEQLGLFG
jgi:hypothetical protein